MTSAETGARPLDRLNTTQGVYDTALNRKGGDNGFDFRQFLARLEVAPDVRIPVGQAPEPLALHDGNVFYNSVLPSPRPICFIIRGIVAHGFATVALVRVGSR